MRRFVPAFLAATLVSVAGCGRTTYQWRPSLVSHVPDSAPVRFTPREASREIRERTTKGRALDWQRGTPKLITPRGDTIVIPHDATMGVRLKQKTGHGVAGAIFGAIIGVGVEIANCPSDWQYCGEENPTELLFAGIGALIGSAIKTDHWIRVRWDPK